MVRSFSEIIKEELNVQELEILDDVDSLVVSPETEANGYKINEEREQRGVLIAEDPHQMKTDCFLNL